MPFDDAQIMQRVQRGQFELFDQLVARYRGPLVRVAQSKLGDAGWAEDVVQETFLAVFAARDTFNPAFSFRTWLWTILLNLCRRQLKRNSNRRNELPHSLLDNSGEFVSQLLNHETGLSRALLAERREALLARLGELPDAEADALRLRFFGGLKFDEIAETMGSSVSGAKRRVKNGLLKLAASLRDEEGDER
ncbi:MAG: RNA polymerase sigma factor [Planctomycetaceae bacterium]